MSWDIKKFQSECSNQGITGVEPYLGAFLAKQWRVQQFGEKAQDGWKEFFSASKTDVAVGDKDWKVMQMTVESYVEAALQALHSMADIMAQLINVTVLNSHLDESDVSLGAVTNPRNPNIDGSNVANAVENLKQSSDFLYVQAFVNTIKHRRLLDTEYRMELSAGTGLDHGIRFLAFTYKGHPKSAMWLSEIVNQTIPSVIDSLNDIGTSLNDYLC